MLEEVAFSLFVFTRHSNVERCPLPLACDVRGCPVGVCVSGTRAGREWRCAVHWRGCACMLTIIVYVRASISRNVSSTYMCAIRVVRGRAYITKVP